MFVLLLACFFDAPTSEPAEPKVHEDLASLERLFPTPDGLSRVRWAGVPLGRPGLGPTDFRLVAWFPDVPEDVRARLLTEPLPRQAPPTDALTLLVLPGGADPAAPAYAAAAFGDIQWEATAAWATGGGILVELYSR